MLGHRNLAVLALAVTLLAFVISCDDNSTDPGETGSLDLVDLETLVEDVAPPEYDGPQTSPADIDSIWTDGNMALLALVFGDHPQSLYNNVESFQFNVELLENILRVNDDGSLVGGAYSDSITVYEDGDSMDVHYTATVAHLSAITPIPTVCQPIIGTAIDIDHMVELEVDHDPGEVIRIGLTITDTEQTILEYNRSAAGATHVRCKLRYTSFDLTDSTFVFKGVAYNQYTDRNDEEFINAFHIYSTATSDFAYRLCWWGGDGLPEPDPFKCVIGGGNKESEFALKYREYPGPSFTIVNPEANAEQVFGANYSEGTSLISEFSDYVDDSLIFSVNVLPTAVFNDPWYGE